MKNKKALTFTLTGIIIAVIIYVIYLWNRAPETVEKLPGIEITASDLTKAFQENEQTANAKYLNKVLEVKGMVSEVDKNEDGNQVLLLAAQDPFSGVQCTMKGTTQASSGETVIIKGFCSGYTTVVLLTDCIRIK